jgi:hypothetical protein
MKPISIPETVPILRMSSSLQEVYKFWVASAVPRVAGLAAKGIGGDPENLCISIAAGIAHWLAVQPYLLSKPTLQVVCPDLGSMGVFGYDSSDQATTIASAVAMLLGRDAGSVNIQVVPVIGATLHSLSDCVDSGRWREFAVPGQTHGDAIWLGQIRAEDLLHSFCFSEDLAHAVYSRVPVGLSAYCDSDLAKKLEVLKITGFYTDPALHENQLSDLGAGWEAYRHDKNCALDCTNSYLLSISGHNEQALDSAGIRKKVGECRELLEFIAAGEAMSVELTPENESEWCLAPPGTLLKCRFDSKRGERYQVLDSTWMVRMSDGAILSIAAGHDFRGNVALTISSKMLAQHPGLKADWLARSIWGEMVFKQEEAKLKGSAPLMGRNRIHAANKKIAAKLSAATEDEAEAMRSMLGSFMSNGPDVGDEALTFFHLMEDGRHAQVIEYLLAKPELVDCFDSQGDTPLMKAVEAGNLEMVKQLLALNARVNTAAADGFCAIHIAARNGLTTIAAKLLDAGADIESTTPHG